MKKLIRGACLRKTQMAGAFLLFCGSVPLSAAMLMGSFSAIATGSNVDLTIAGKIDWIHWGLDTSSSLNRKWGVPGLISDFSSVGTGVVDIYQYNDNYNSYTWHDGWPVGGDTNTTTGVWAYQVYPPTLAGAGFQFTVPATTNQCGLQVFVGTFAARGKFLAKLSDGSAPDYTDTSLENATNGPGVVYSLTYQANSNGPNLIVEWTLDQRVAGTNSSTANVTLQAAASSGQRLIIEYHTLELFDYDYGNVTLQSATLQGEIASVPVPVQLVEPKMLGSDFVFSFMTQSNVTYSVEYADQLRATNWLTLLTLPGTGTITSVTNQAATRQRFYRVQTQ